MSPFLAAALSISLIGVLAVIQQIPVFRSGVEIVHIDASVLDRNRRPVKGLAAGDFTVLEDGKPRPIVVFSAFEVADPPTPAPGWRSEVPIDVATNDMKDTRLFVIVMDDALTPRHGDFLNNAKTIAASIIDKLGPQDLAAIVFTGDNRKYENFTNDKARLRAAIASFTPGLANYRFGWMMDQQHADADTLFFLGAVRTLSDIADVLIAAPNRRKVLFWVSPGVPLDLAETAPKWVPPATNGFNPPMLIGIDMRDLKDRTEEIFERAQRSNVAVYPIDPTGLGGMLEFLRTVPTGANREAKATAQQDFLAMTAANTGGRAVMNTNDFEPGIRDIFTENSSYYLIGFEPAKFDSDGRRHRIEIKVSRPDVDVRTRNHYYSPSPDKPGKGKDEVTVESAALSKAIGSMLPDGNTPMRVAIAPMTLPGQKTVTVSVVLGVRQPVPEAARYGRVTDTTELQITAYSPDGKPRGTQRHTAKVVIRDGADGEAIYEVLGRIDLPAGRYSLRLAVYNPANGKSGSVFADVTIPDYTKETFAVSPAVLSAWPPRISAPEDLFWGLMPLAPTSEREFGNSGQVTAFVRLYQGDGKRPERVTVAMRVRDVNDRVIASDTQTLEAYDFGHIGPNGKSNGVSTADTIFPIPLPTFSPGEYLITIEATRGATVIRRDVRFSVK